MELSAHLTSLHGGANPRKGVEVEGNESSYKLPFGFFDLLMLTQNTPLALADLEQSVTQIVEHSIMEEYAGIERDCHQRQNLLHVVN